MSRVDLMNGGPVPARLPTRVSNACDRCRSQKQRCDLFRPCQNCAHVKARCTDDDAPPAKRRKTRKPKKSRGSGEEESGGHSEVAVTPTAQHAKRNNSTDSRSDGQGWEAHGSGEDSHVVPYPSPPKPPSGPYEDLSSTAWGSSNPRRSLTPSVTDFGEAESAIRMTRKILGEQLSDGSAARATFAIPGSDAHEAVTPSRGAEGKLMSVIELLGIELPPRSTCDELLDSYFFTVHWFSLVIYEPKFRARYNRIIDTGLVTRTDHGFLLLLLMVLAMGCWYRSKDQINGDPGATCSPSGLRWEDAGNTFLGPVREQFMDIMDEDSLEFVQLCELLGSYYLYHGKPRSSFSILGAATKSSQAMGLHRDCGQRFSYEAAEERKRVWWTLYTWDRFATIIYGRPLGINDKDCTVPMPSDFKEDMRFGQNLSSESICLSTYQTQLNKSYQIASPIIENIFGIRTSTDVKLRAQLPGMVAEADRQLQEWRLSLPPQFSFEDGSDITDDSTTEEKMHQLQKLALELTYNNLIIIIHRPLLADQRAGLSRFRQREQQQSTSPGDVPLELHYPSHHGDLSFKRCLDSALAISKVESKRNLLLLARRTHLVAFLGINLFTSSVVMSICALSDTLSDVAQEAKRGMARTLQMQKLLSPYASLSLQSSAILEDLVRLILRKESMEMLRAMNNAMLIPGETVDGDEAAKENRGGEQWSGNPQSPRLLSSISNRASLQQPGNQSYPEDAQLNESLLSLQKVFQDNSSSGARPQPHHGTYNSGLNPHTPTPWNLVQQWAPSPTGGVGMGNNIPDGNASTASGEIRGPPGQPEGMAGGAASWYQGAGAGAGAGGASAGGGPFEIDDLGQFWLWNLEPFQ